jgi:hypothetical protein
MFYSIKLNKYFKSHMDCHTTQFFSSVVSGILCTLYFSIVYVELVYFVIMLLCLIIWNLFAIVL